VSSIGKSAFINNYNLVNIIFEDGGSLILIDEKAFARAAIENITIPATVTTIGDSAFMECTSLTSVIFTAGCEDTVTIGNGAFNDTLVASITLPSTATCISCGMTSVVPLDCNPTSQPTAQPTTPTYAPTTAIPSIQPTEQPTFSPSYQPSAVPTETPSAVPTETPSAVPTETPSAVPTETPSAVPTETPSAVPTEQPTGKPTTTVSPTSVLKVASAFNDTNSDASVTGMIIGISLIICAVLLVLYRRYSTYTTPYDKWMANEESKRANGIVSPIHSNGIVTENSGHEIPEIKSNDPWPELYLGPTTDNVNGNFSSNNPMMNSVSVSTPRQEL
jgi:hypothetical protein